MDYDDELYLAATCSESNTDEGEIDSELEDKLYAAVFHSNDILPKSKEISGYNSTLLTEDVSDLWKNIHDRESLNYGSHQKSDNNIFGKKCSHQDPQSIKLPESPERFGSRTENHCDERIEISGSENNPEESLLSASHNRLTEDQNKFIESTKSCHVLANKQAEIDLYSEKDTGAGFGTMQRKDKVEDRRENSSNCGQKNQDQKIAKKSKSSPKKLPKSTDSQDCQSLMNSFWWDPTHNNDDACVESDSLKNSRIAFTPSDANESSDVNAEEELEKPALLEKESEIFSFPNESCLVEENPDRPSSIKPEEELEKAESTQKKFVSKTSDQSADVKPEEEQLEKIESMVKEVYLHSSNNPSSHSPSDKSSSSYSVQDVWVEKSIEENEKTLTIDEEDEIITLEDSEGSIYEVPVPPKPKPLTINLEDSESSTSSDSDTSMEEITPKKLVESYKRAVAESALEKRKKKEREKLVAQNRKRLSRKSSSSSSDSNDSMTENEEENWGIIARSQLDRDEPVTTFRKNVTGSETDNSTTDFEQRHSCEIIEDGDNSRELIFEEPKNLIRESQRESATSYSKIRKRTGGNSSSEKSLVIDNRPGEAEKLSLSQQILSENNEKDKGTYNNQNLLKDDILIINAKSVGLSELDENREVGTSMRTPENRKRPIPDSRKKSKHQNSAKKAKSSDQFAVAGCSSGNSHKENKQSKNEEQRRNRTADYFFRPMTSEMENFYNESWGGEDFDIDTLQRQMPRDPRQWAILKEDLLGSHQRRSRYWTESKCRNCHHTGHNISECPEKKKVPSCHMCGTPGHKEPRCPHKMCLGCGKKQNIYMQVCNGCRRAWCNRCQSYGHVEEKCPDLWRRYHVSTSYNDVNTHLCVADVMKPTHLLSCCNCAKRGHDSTTCENYRWSRHFPTPAYVTNYITGPAYTEDPVLEEVGFPSEERDYVATEKRGDNGAVHTSTSSNEGRKGKFNVDRILEGNPEMDEILQSVNKNVDKSIEKTGKQVKDHSKSTQDKAQKSDELLPTNPKSMNNGEVVLTLKSQLLDTGFTQAGNYGVYTHPLFSKQYEELVDSDLSREFLLNLISQFPIELNIMRNRNGTFTMSVRSNVDLHFPIWQTIIDWLKWPLDERNRFVALNLPTIKEKLLKLLTEKLYELKRNIGDPFELHATIDSLKRELRSFQRQSKAGKKMSTASKRARIVEELAKSQCKLNMILFGQRMLNKTGQSVQYLRTAVNRMRKAGSADFVCAAMYLKIVHHYNIIFAAYTPDDLKKLLELYRLKPSSDHATHQKRSSTRQTDPKYTAFIKSLRSTSKKRNINSSPNVRLNASNEILPENMNNDGRFSDPAFRKKLNYYEIQHQLEIEGTGFSNPNINFDHNLPPAQHPATYDSGRPENNYYNSKYDFGDYSNLQRYGAGVQKNSQQEDYITIDNHSSQNDYSNGNTDFYKKSRGRYIEKVSWLKRKNETIGNGFQNDPKSNIQNISSPGKNRWLDSYAPRNISSQDMFYSDTQAELSQEFLCNDTLNVFPKNDIEEISNRWDRNGPSTSRMHNQLRPRFDEDPDVRDEYQSTASKKSKKKKKNKQMSPYWQKRAGDVIAKYIISQVPLIVREAKLLQKKISDKCLSMHNVIRFEKIVEREMKKK